VTVKFISLWPLSRLYGIGPKTSMSVALLLAQSGEFALVLFALARGVELLDERLFQHLIIVVILSMLATPVLEKVAVRIYLTSRRSDGPTQLTIEKSEQEVKRVILAGFGRMGHRIGYILELMEIPYVAIDTNASLVKRESSEGRSVYFGDAQRPEVLRAAGAAEAPLVIVSIDDLEATERVVCSLHSAFPDIPVFARGHDLTNCRDLKELGAYFTVSETLEASAELARAALLYMGTEDREIVTALEQFRVDYYGKINNDSKIEEQA